ncbi:hypothetical protein [Brevundimonas sp.]|uniref:hypothetical protein n=1 Tax=Brevundimonas sp. TaxID=1871086 RepID=UPI00289EF079|nr:hypothetical protein [Brevundimonas sp.]
MAALPAEQLPQPLDIVWAKFPYTEKPGQPGEVAHPALVFTTYEFRTGEFSIQVAFGTSKLKTEERPYDFRIQNFRDMQFAGLAQATRFDLDRIKYLPWDSDWFVSPAPQKYPSPVLGRLLDQPANRLRNILRVRHDNGMSVPYRAPKQD